MQEKRNDHRNPANARDNVVDIVLREFLYILHRRIDPIGTKKIRRETK
jgi:hypothetical protein